MMRTGILGGPLADRLLSRMGDPSARGYCEGSACHGLSKLEVLLGQSFTRELLTSYVRCRLKPREAA